MNEQCLDIYSGGLGQNQGIGQLGQGIGQSILPNYIQYYPGTVQEREPRAWELKIERNGNSIRMDYGSELRVLIADPFKGIDLREAIQKLKEALCHNPDPRP